MSATLDQVYEFGAFTFDLRKGTLRRPDGEAILRPKAHTLLAHLAQNMGRVVPKDELMDAAWPGIYVTEDSLTQSIREIRKALGDDGQSVVRTVPRRGYMLVGKSDATPETTGQPIVAVLRFRNDSGDPERAAIVDGFAEDVITGLAHYGSVVVLARNSSFQFSSFDPATWSSAAAQIGADYLVEGSVRWSGKAALISVNLIDANGLKQLWGDRYEAHDVELFAVQQEIGAQIVNRLVTRLDEDSLRRSAVKPTASLAAYELVTRAVSALRGHDSAMPVGAKRDLALAIEKDPSYGLAYSFLALADLMIAGYGRASGEVLAAALETARRGVALAPTQAVGPRVVSLIRIFLRQHAASESDLRVAIGLNGCDADSLEQMGFLLTVRGRPLEALEWIERAIKLNPIFPEWYHYDRGLARYGLGEYAGAVEAFEHVAQRPPWIEGRLAASYAQLGDLKRARLHMDNLQDRDPGFDPREDARRYVAFEHAADLDHLIQGMTLALES